MSAAMMLAAWALEASVGWPAWLYACIRHPVVWFGWLVTRLDRTLNRPEWSHAVRYIMGAVSTLTLVALAILLVLPIEYLAVQIIVAASLIASRSLHSHVQAVLTPLAGNNNDAARQAVAMIVGRDPNQLDAPAIVRATLESLAENTSDGVIAPLFWGVIFGLPGIAGYKAINTLDSMIGHKSERYHAFGGFAARLDDVANLVPARLTGLLIALVSRRPAAFQTLVKDAGQHRSPNAGWPEAAMAGALGVRLSGPRLYAEGLSDSPWLNADARDPNADDIARGLSLYRTSMMLAAFCLLALTIVQVWA